MVRTLNLREWAGLWVAIDSDGRVRLSSEDVEHVISEIERLELDGLEIVRARFPASRSCSNLADAWSSGTRTSGSRTKHLVARSCGHRSRSGFPDTVWVSRLLLTQAVR